MRAFHLAWWAFFMAFFIWFSAAPLLGEIRTSLDLSNEEVWTSSIIGVAGTVFIRFLLGPLCDKYGARTLFSLVLMSASIPTGCTGLVNSASGLYIVRLFIGIAGGSFVTCQYWTSMMFSKEVVGTVNGIVAGWGNLGGTWLFGCTTMWACMRVLTPSCFVFSCRRCHAARHCK